MTVPSQDQEPALPPQVTLAFAPVHKKAFGVATGVTFGVGLFVLTAIATLAGPEGASSLNLLNEYFAGYRVSPAGAFIGLLWGFVTGFVMGWFVAFSRNLVIAAWIFWVRTRAELRATREFLDHI
jgi:hypothetical protein